MTSWASPLTVLRWLPDYRPSWLRADFIAGITLAAYLLPAILTNTPSIGRMTSVMFPMALMLVQAVPARVWPALAVIFGAAQLSLAARHFIWQPPY